MRERIKIIRPAKIELTRPQRVKLARRERVILIRPQHVLFDLAGNQGYSDSWNHRPSWNEAKRVAKMSLLRNLK